MCFTGIYRNFTGIFGKMTSTVSGVAASHPESHAKSSPVLYCSLRSVESVTTAFGRELPEFYWNITGISGKMTSTGVRSGRVIPESHRKVVPGPLLGSVGG